MGQRAIIMVALIAGAGLALAAGFALADADKAGPAPPAPPDARALHPERIVQPPGLGTLTLTGPDGVAREVRCETCHQGGDEPMRVGVDELTEVHAGLTLRHGALVCGSCHHPTQRDQLRLADGRGLDFERVIELCGQCHGPQHRDYRHGAHGGMQGHWDLRLGERTRNSCVVCHDPHAPAIGQFMPAPGPRDRMMTPAHPGADHD